MIGFESEPFFPELFNAVDAEQRALRSMTRLLDQEHLHFDLARQGLVARSGSEALQTVLLAVAERRIKDEGRASGRLRVLMTSPGIPYPYRLAQMAGYETVVIFNRTGKNLDLDVDKLAEKIAGSDVDAVYLESPTNIGGKVLEARHIDKLYKACLQARNRPTLIIDQCFALLAPDDNRVPLVADVLARYGPNQNWVQLWDTGKTLYVEAGAKLGFAVFGHHRTAEIAHDIYETVNYERHLGLLSRVIGAMDYARERYPTGTPYLDRVRSTIRSNAETIVEAFEKQKHALTLPGVGSNIVLPTEVFKHTGNGPKTLNVTRAVVAGLERRGLRVTDASGYLDPAAAYPHHPLPRFEGKPIGTDVSGLRVALARPPEQILMLRDELVRIAEPTTRRIRPIGIAPPRRKQRNGPVGVKFDVTNQVVMRKPLYDRIRMLICEPTLEWDDTTRFTYSIGDGNPDLPVPFDGTGALVADVRRVTGERVKIPMKIVGDYVEYEDHINRPEYLDPELRPGKRLRAFTVGRSSDYYGMEDALDDRNLDDLDSCFKDWEDRARVLALAERDSLALLPVPHPEF
jgi:aspartate/methionine/tyrosine aminotransferase